MGQDQPVKALVVAFAGEPAAAVYVIHRLRPEALCFVLPEPAKTLVETEVQPNVEQMPKRWDWVTLPEPDDDVACHRLLGPLMSDVLRTWEVQPSELVVDLTGATPAIAGALTLVTLPWISPIVSLLPGSAG
jgi:hypothetical protein